MYVRNVASILENFKLNDDTFSELREAIYVGWGKKNRRAREDLYATISRRYDIEDERDDRANAYVTRKRGRSEAAFGGEIIIPLGLFPPVAPTTPR